MVSQGAKVLVVNEYSRKSSKKEVSLVPFTSHWRALAHSQSLKVKTGLYMEWLHKSTV